MDKTHMHMELHAIGGGTGIFPPDIDEMILGCDEG